MSCEDTGEARAGRACELGKICEAGRCVPCVVGAECDVDMPCFLGRVTSCDDGLVCEPQPQSGMICGTDEIGRTKYCVSGQCSAPCREGPCMTSAGACQTTHWDCTSGGAPTCISTDAADGVACDHEAVCRAGDCVKRSLVNGDFSGGLHGWFATGEAADFLVTADASNHDRQSVSTSTDGTNAGGAARGTLSQEFTVPSDALAIRFVISGGRAHVRLKDEDGVVIEDCTGGSSAQRIPVSWDLSNRRGQSLTIAIEDDLASSDWGYVTVSGFDVIRDVDGPLRNPQFRDALSGWETTGDGLYFNIFQDYNHGEVFTELQAAYGRRLSISTYARDPGATSLWDGSRGTVSQTFMVPQDAVAIRFNVHGGRQAYIKLYEGDRELHRVTANDNDYVKVIVDWPLTPHRGKMLRLSIEDETTVAPFGYIGSSGFDLITSYNGP